MNMMMLYQHENFYFFISLSFVCIILYDKIIPINLMYQPWNNLIDISHGLIASKVLVSN